MPRQEFFVELKIMEKELLEQLEAVRKLLKSYATREIENELETNTKKVKMVRTKFDGKGDRSWSDYVLLMLKRYGGRAKTRDLVNFIMKSNPEQSEKTVLATVRTYLSKLYKKGIIDAKKGLLPTDGYEFFIKE